MLSLFLQPAIIVSLTCIYTQTCKVHLYTLTYIYIHIQIYFVMIYLFVDHLNVYIDFLFERKIRRKVRNLWTSLLSDIKVQRDPSLGSLFLVKLFYQIWNLSVNPGTIQSWVFKSYEEISLKCRNWKEETLLLRVKATQYKEKMKSVYFEVPKLRLLKFSIGFLGML